MPIRDWLRYGDRAVVPLRRSVTYVVPSSNSSSVWASSVMSGEWSIRRIRYRDMVADRLLLMSRLDRWIRRGPDRSEFICNEDRGRVATDQPGFLHECRDDSEDRAGTTPFGWCSGPHGPKRLLSAVWRSSRPFGTSLSGRCWRKLYEYI